MSSVVHCRAEFAYPGSPTGFGWENRYLRVRTILTRWRTPHGKGFLVRTDGNSCFELFYSYLGREWQIQAASCPRESL